MHQAQVHRLGWPPSPTCVRPRALQSRQSLQTYSMVVIGHRSTQSHRAGLQVLTSKSTTNTRCGSCEVGPASIEEAFVASPNGVRQHSVGDQILDVHHDMSPCRQLTLCYRYQDLRQGQQQVLQTHRTPPRRLSPCGLDPPTSSYLQLAGSTSACTCTHSARAFMLFYVRILCPTSTAIAA